MPTATEFREPQVEDRVQVRGPARVLRMQPMPQLPPLLSQRPLFADSLLDSGDQERLVAGLRRRSLSRFSAY
jgi:hypothetical protein